MSEKAVKNIPQEAAKKISGNSLERYGWDEG